VREIPGHTMAENAKGDLLGLYLFSCFSFFGNVGFYTGIEPYLTVGSKIVLCFLMLLGHLGPMTFFQLFQNHLDKNSNVHYSFVEEDFLIG
jgi:Trk-type K+ transport system membrane component